MSNMIIQPSSVSNAANPPVCAGCGHVENVAPAFVERKAPFFCIHCCNYLDKNGEILA